MKQLVVLAALVAFCYGNAIPLVPGDNSHYVPGQSRYIWGPDNDGSPVLIDLQQPVDKDFLSTRNGSNNQYWLYTRQNPASPQFLYMNNVNSVYNSNYRARRPLVVVTHGWHNNGNSLYNPTICHAILTTQDANVIVVDWHELASNDYATAAAGVPDVGAYLGRFLVWLINTAGGDWNNTHLIGFSMGSHVSAGAARVPGAAPRRITGLDPAGPIFENTTSALNSNDARYVEAIHTNGGGYGTSLTSGHADFFPNGGRNPQPGCSTDICSHVRVWDLYASSILNVNHLLGRRCVNLNQAVNVQCTGGIFVMGNADINKHGTGIFGLRTGSLYPY